MTPPSALALALAAPLAAACAAPPPHGRAGHDAGAANAGRDLDDAALDATDPPDAPDVPDAAPDDAAPPRAPFPDLAIGAASEGDGALFDSASATVVTRSPANLRQAFFLAREFDSLPAELVVAGTEIGFVGMAAGRRRVIDLCGLNDPEIARHGLSLDRLLERDRPDVLYYPHPDYREMRRALFADPRFVADYERIPRKELGPFLPFALRKSGPFYEQLKSLLATRRAELPLGLSQGLPPRGRKGDAGAKR